MDTKDTTDPMFFYHENYFTPGPCMWTTLLNHKQKLTEIDHFKACTTLQMFPVLLYIKGTRAPCASFLMCECACIRVFLFCCCCCAVVLCCCAVVPLFRCAVVPFCAVVLSCSCSVVLCCSVVLLFCCSVLPQNKTQVFAAPIEFELRSASNVNSDPLAN